MPKMKLKNEIGSDLECENDDGQKFKSPLTLLEGILFIEICHKKRNPYAKFCRWR